jgi:hypothetical protein
MNLDQSSFTLLDGPLRPNDAIDGAQALVFEAPDDLVACDDGALLVSDGKAIFRIESISAHPTEPIARFEGNVTALCRHSAETVIAAVDGEGIYAVSTRDGAVNLLSAETRLHSAITACAVAEDGAVLAARATTIPGRYPFAHELFGPRGSGQLLRVSSDGACAVLADGLRGPHGVAPARSGGILIAETWGASIRLLENSGRLVTPISSFAGYPGRLSPLASGGYLLACLSRRDPLVDFVRSEKAFADRMVAQLDPDHWIAPRLDSRLDFKVPAQAGATRLFGEIKPWAPSLSYGLVCELSPDMVPWISYHSRANGVRHGIVSAVEWNGGVAAVSKATGEVLFMDSRLQIHDA